MSDSQRPARPRGTAEAAGETRGASDRRPTFGLDNAPVPCRRWETCDHAVCIEYRRLDWRERKHRQKLRSDNAPVPALFDDTPPPGRLRRGLIEHTVPGRGNRRKDDE